MRGEHLPRAHASQLIWFVWRNLYSRDLLDRHRIRFDEGTRYGEDSPFNLNAFYHSLRAVVVQQDLYFYRENPASLTQARFRPWLEAGVAAQYASKRAFLANNQLGGEWLQDLSRHVVYRQLPELLVNVVRLDPVGAGAKIRELISLPMIESSLHDVPLWNPRVPRGIAALVFACKTKQPWIIQRLLRSQKRGD